MDHSFIELQKTFHHHKAMVHEEGHTWIHVPELQFFDLFCFPFFFFFFRLPSVRLDDLLRHREIKGKAVLWKLRSRVPVYQSPDFFQTKSPKLHQAYRILSAGLSPTFSSAPSRRAFSRPGFAPWTSHSGLPLGMLPPDGLGAPLLLRPLFSLMSPGGPLGPPYPRLPATPSTHL